MTIDYAKYEGHTPGPWREVVSCGYGPWANDLVNTLSRHMLYADPGVKVPHNKHDANLIADAPLLLEQCKRLEAALIAIRDSEFCSYESTSGGGQYGIGVTDGHRYCANIASASLNDDKEQSQ